MAGRMDLREWHMVTIDGEDAKDLDDAVSLTKEGENYKLGDPHCRCDKLCTREKCIGSGSVKPRDKCLSGRQSYSDASA